MAAYEIGSRILNDVQLYQIRLVLKDVNIRI